MWLGSLSVLGFAGIPPTTVDPRCRGLGEAVAGYKGESVTTALCDRVGVVHGLTRTAIANKGKHPTSTHYRILRVMIRRSTTGQLVRKVVDGETAGVFLAHGQPVRTDDLLDVYTSREFSRVFAANTKIRELLQPMFATAPEAFTRSRKKGGANLSLAKIERIEQMLADGVPAAEAANRVKVSRATVYRHISGRDDSSAC